MNNSTGREAALIAFAGPATIRQVSEACARLREAVLAGGDIDLDVSEVTACDLTFIQLVESARRSCASLGARLALTAPAAGPLRDVLERGGFIEGADAERLNFWTHAGAAR